MALRRLLPILAGILLLPTSLLASQDEMPAWMGIPQQSDWRAPTALATTTYERFLPLAQAGDPTSQNLLGFMFFHGEGVKVDYDESHHWFHRAAEEGDPRAQRNLGVFHSGAVTKVPKMFIDAEESNLWFSLYEANTPTQEGHEQAAQSYIYFLDPEALLIPDPDTPHSVGEQVYKKFCAGCHGFTGIAAYPAAPSFLAGETLEKSDKTLLQSIMQGKGLMPAWEGTLTVDQATDTIAYLRHRFRRSATPATALQRALPQQSRPQNQQATQQMTQAGTNRDLGEAVYMEFCAGCHGFNGIAYYVHSPSFALRERLHKSDMELTQSIRVGRNSMPAWKDLLSARQISSVIQFIRTLAPAYETGIAKAVHHAPDIYYRFRPVGERGGEWNNADPMGIPYR